MSSKYLKLLKILELSSIKVFNENALLFKENVAFKALLLQGLVHMEFTAKKFLYLVFITMR